MKKSERMDVFRAEIDRLLREEENKCSICGRKLRDVEFIDPEEERKFMRDHPEEGCFLVPHGLLRYVKRRSKSGV
jgi:hypothetical protein